MTLFRDGLPFGTGRSYSDCCLNPQGTLWLTRELNHFLAFDAQQGRLTCEAGVSLKEIQQLTVPRGWMLPVTPGTQFITVGGAIANDVHGKNHHVHGSFGNHVRKLKLLRTDSEVIECSPSHNSQWFKASVGGLGLTGLILAAEIQLLPIQSNWLLAEIVAFAKLNDFFHLSQASSDAWDYTVAWLDCMPSHKQRGLFMRARLSSAPPTWPSVLGTRGKGKLNRKPSIPFAPHALLTNPLALTAFNHAYYYLHRYKFRNGTRLIHYEAFFYQLDFFSQWHRPYVAQKFYQYQCVIPTQASDALQALLHEVKRAGERPLLAVLKNFGNCQANGMLSFPLPGITLAIDLPNKGAHTRKLFERLDSIVQASNGRLYLAKDARMPKKFFEDSYPALHEFLQYRDAGISSALSLRLMGS